MAIYTIGDLHLSLNSNKKMDIFPGWENYVARLRENWLRTVGPADTVVLAGDISWSMSLEGTREDFAFLQSLPGRKLLLKGNHDYWWATRSKMEGYLQRGGFDSLSFLHNCACPVEGLVLCGSRGWMFERGQPHDRKIAAREAMRLELSLRAGEGWPGERVVFLHYPPVYGDECLAEVLDVLLRWGVKRCYYGHIHAAACAYALNGPYLGIDFRLVSADFAGFCPVPVPPQAAQPPDAART